MHRYRLIDEAGGADLGPFVSMRLAYQPGEVIGRAPAERFEIVGVVDPENDDPANQSFRSYLVVRRL